MINYNMRCIETGIYEMTMEAQYKINYNMRCIETVVVSEFKTCKSDKLQHEMY